MILKGNGPMRNAKTTLVQVHATEQSDESINLIKRWRNCELVTLFFVIISMFASITDYEINYSASRNYKNCSENYSEGMNLRYLTLISSVSALFFLIIGTHAQFQWEEYLFIMDPRCFQYKEKRSYRKVILESLLLLIFPYPSLNAELLEEYGMKRGFSELCYTLSEIMYSFMWFRIYFLLKVVASNSQYVSHVARRVSLECRVKPGIIFNFKCMFRKNPLIMIIFFIGLPSILAIGMISRVYERPLIALSQQG